MCSSDLPSTMAMDMVQPTVTQIAPHLNSIMMAVSNTTMRRRQTGYGNLRWKELMRGMGVRNPNVEGMENLGMRSPMKVKENSRGLNK